MDWSSLHPDLIRIISKKLINITDFLRFRLACKAWLAASPFSDAPPQIPWLLSKKHFSQSDLTFYSLSSGEVFKIRTSQVAGRWVDGPSEKYLLTYLPGSTDYRLLNPISKKEIDLPVPDGNLKKPKVVLIGPDPDPVRSEDYVVAIHGNDSNLNVSFLAVFQSKDMEWIKIYDLSRSGCYCDGKYISVNRSTDIVQIVDVLRRKQTLSCQIERTSQFGGFQHHVVSSGEILRVSCYDDKLLPLDQCKFKIHKLNLGIGNGKPHWVEMTSIGDQMLFLDKSNGFSISASRFGGITGNCIYFLKEKENGESFGCNYSLCRYEIESERTEELPCPFVKGGTWFVPSL